MALINGFLAKQMIAYTKSVENVVQTDPDVAAQNYYNALETAIFNTIKAATFVIEPGEIIVEGAEGPSTNASPIVIQGGIQ